MNQNIFTVLEGKGNAGFSQSTLNLDSYIQGMLPQHSQVTCFETDAIEANKVSDPFMHQIRCNIACKCSKVWTHQHHSTTKIQAHA
jgi:hypothetical protein